MKGFIFSKVAIKKRTFPEVFFQRFCLLFRNTNFKEHLSRVLLISTNFPQFLLTYFHGYPLSFEGMKFHLVYPILPFLLPFRFTTMQQNENKCPLDLDESATSTGLTKKIMIQPSINKITF